MALHGGGITWPLGRRMKRNDHHYLQVKYQVVVALLGDAVMQPHCRGDKRTVINHNVLHTHRLLSFPYAPVSL